MKQLVFVFLGALLGAACKFLCDSIIRVLLTKREKNFEESRKEKIVLLVIMAVFGGMIVYLAPPSPETVFLFLLLIISEAVAVIDLHTRLIPNELVLAILAVAVLFGVPGLFGLSGWPTWKPVSALIGLAVCFLVFTLPALFSKQVGAGDIKLAAAIGFCMGLWNSLFAIVLMGILVLIYMFVQAKLPVVKFFVSTIPMGPFLALSMLFVLLSMKLPILSGLFFDMPF